MRHRPRVFQGNSTCATPLLAWELRSDSANCARHASELVRRVEAGEEIDITVAGRLAARLVPATPKRWQRWSDIANLFNGPPDPGWDGDRDLLDQTLDNPWEPT